MVYPLSAKNSPSTMLAIILLSWKTIYFCYCLRQVQTFEVQTKSAKLLKSSAVYCVSLQKYSVFSTMQGCIVPPKSNKLIACVWDVAKTCVSDSLKTRIVFNLLALLSTSIVTPCFATVNPWTSTDSDRLVRRVICFSRSIDWRTVLCTRLKPFYPLSRLLGVVFCMSAVPY